MKGEGAWVSFFVWFGVFLDVIFYTEFSEKCCFQLFYAEENKKGLERLSRDIDIASAIHMCSMILD